MYAPNFSRQELIASNYGQKHDIDNTPNEFQEANLQRLSWFLQAVKHGLSTQLKTNVLIRVNSGFRCYKLNKELGGSKKSFHMRGLAADITCSHLSPYKLALWISNNMKQIGYEELIQEYDRWVHVAIPPIQPSNEELTAQRVGKKAIYAVGILPSGKIN